MKYYDTPIVYGAKHIDKDVRAASRSGGVFTAVSDYILANNGIVYGCVMENPYKAIHIRAESKSDRDRMRGSKYIQSDLADVFNQVKNDADTGRKVLFSGTSCQVAGLKSFLGKDYDNILYVDIVCHGVPSPKVWKDYVCWQEKKNKTNCVEVDFRNKRDFGWKDHVETLYMEEECGSKTVVSGKVFATMFYSHNILRPACFKCPYKSINHPGDITLADFWGIDRVDSQFNDNKGVSLLLINNERGSEIINLVEDKFAMISSDIESAMQSSFKHSWPIPETKEQFWKDFNKFDFTRIAKKYGEYGCYAAAKKLTNRVKNKIFRILKLKK